MPFPLKFHLRRQEYRLRSALPLASSKNSFNSFNSLTPHILETAASENLRKLSEGIDDARQQLDDAKQVVKDVRKVVRGSK